MRIISNQLNSAEMTKKILIMGLDNSGKTSILLSLQRNTNLLSYFRLKPTRGINIVNIEDHGAKFNIWDFGGQEEYRKDYFQRLNEYLRETDKIIFVIDIQDMERYDKALEYLTIIVNTLQNIGNKINFSIFLHKMDPDLNTNAKFSDEAISINLLSKIDKIVPTTFPYDLFKTSIYTVFQKRPFYRR
ncbi:MAG: ADP-ribosylation factor-like protein [Candidatus Helarchaeota archaeon]